MLPSTDKPHRAHRTLTQNDLLETTHELPKVLSQQAFTKAPIETDLLETTRKLPTVLSQQILTKAPIKTDLLETTRKLPKVISHQIIAKAPIETDHSLLVAPNSSLPVHDALTTSSPLYIPNTSEAYSQDNSESLVRIIEANFDKLFKKVAELAVEVKLLTANLNKLQTRSDDNTNKPATAEMLMITNSLPFLTIDKLKDFEYQLEVNATLKSSVGSYLQQIGGSGAKDTTLRILRKVFSNAVAQNCSWLGLRDNFSIHNLALIKIIKDAVMVNNNMTDKEFEETCSEWFRQGKQRFSREEKAKAKAQA